MVTIAGAFTIQSPPAMVVDTNFGSCPKFNQL